MYTFAIFQNWNHYWMVMIAQHKQNSVLLSQWFLTLIAEQLTLKNLTKWVKRRFQAAWMYTYIRVCIDRYTCRYSFPQFSQWELFWLGRCLHMYFSREWMILNDLHESEGCWMRSFTIVFFRQLHEFQCDWLKLFW